MAGIFSHYRSAHEPDKQRMLRCIIGGLPPHEVRAELARLDRQQWLEMNSSQLNGFVLEHLVELFPEAKFILPIRRCRDWLQSIMNHHFITLKRNEDWNRYRAYRFGKYGYEHHPAEKAVKEAGLYPTESYVRFWSDYNHRMLAQSPVDRTFVLSTQALPASTERLAAFLNIEPSTLDSRQGCLNRRSEKKFRVFNVVDPAYVEHLLAKHGASHIEQ
jgi:hypothetical protein